MFSKNNKIKNEVYELGGVLIHVKEKIQPYFLNIVFQQLKKQYFFMDSLTRDRPEPNKCIIVKNAFKRVKMQGNFLLNY